MCHSIGYEVIKEVEVMSNSSLEVVWNCPADMYRVPEGT